MRCLTVFARHEGLAGLTITEFNPDHGAEDGSTTDTLSAGWWPCSPGDALAGHPSGRAEELDPLTGSREDVSASSPLTTSDGRSDSWEIPNSSLAAPRAQTISVADGSNDTPARSGSGPWPGLMHKPIQVA
jgi:hypothetical protein